MKLTENTKLTLTVGQIKQLIKEAADVEEAVEQTQEEQQGEDEEPQARQEDEGSLEDLLNSLLGDEYNAWKQYTMMTMAAKGKSLARVEEVFKNAGNEEMYDHFENLYKWMQSAGMPPMNDPEELDAACKCPYVKIQREQDTESLVKIAVEAEQAAISAYEKALELKSVKAYPDLVYLLSEFLKDERGHLRELQDVQSQIEGFENGEGGEDEGEEEVDDEENA